MKHARRGMIFNLVIITLILRFGNIYINRSKISPVLKDCPYNVLCSVFPKGGGGRGYPGD